MCGRFVGFRKHEELARYFPIDESMGDVSASFNIAPTREVLAIYRRQEKNILDRFHWGLVPFWAKDRSMASRMINARLETLADKPSFKHAFKRQRCLIPADGFYEWSGPKGRSQSYYLTTVDKKPFAFAGIWDTWRSKEQPDRIHRSCAIITTTASASVRSIHHRMPVILKPEAYQEWLDRVNQDTGKLQALLRRQTVAELASCPVSSQVNTASSDRPEYITPMEQMSFDF